MINKILIILLFVFTNNLNAQDKVEQLPWDNQIYLGNKISYGLNKWKYSTELQVRLKNDFRSLDNWYLEQVASYLMSNSIELVPDLRYTIKPEKTEYRPGFGILYKIKKNKIQFINQDKIQLDISNKGKVSYAFREVVFLNYRFNEKTIATFVAGFIYRWRDEWNGFQYIRIGPGISYIFDEKHILNISYFTGLENASDYSRWSGIPMIQLIINVGNNYKYVPAYYFNF